jgi:hypothetical protein
MPAIEGPFGFTVADYEASRSHCGLLWDSGCLVVPFCALVVGGVVYKRTGRWGIASWDWLVQELGWD